jgi:AcrR family transcriptional regulator
MLKADAQTTTSTRDRIVNATLETLKKEGFAGASARAIARRGGFNQALVFYHFGTVQNLLLAALDATSAARLARYEESLATASSPPEMIAAARQLHAEDAESGHITVLSEMIAGSVGNPELGPQITARMTPWIDFVEREITRALGDSPLAPLLPARDLAFAVVAFYLGLDLLTQLDGDRSKTDSLMQLADSGLSMIAPLLEQGRD